MFRIIEIDFNTKRTITFDKTYDRTFESYDDALIAANDQMTYDDVNNVAIVQIVTHLQK